VILFTMKTQTVEDRFWSKVDIGGSEDCWNWTGAIDTAGYGAFAIRHGKKINSHRMAYIIVVGDIPNEMYVCHMCDNRSCCNPNHLFLGTARDNNLDMRSKGRWVNGLKRNPSLAARGSKNGGHKLTERDVIDIRRRLSNGDKQKEIASEYGVCRDTIYHISIGKYWSWLK